MGCDPQHQFGMALVVVSTDPDGDGQVSSNEIIDGLRYGTVYGIAQTYVAWSHPGCPVMYPDWPDGIKGGVHVYADAAPYHKLDGSVVDLQTCDPTTVPCHSLHDPYR